MQTSNYLKSHISKMRLIVATFLILITGCGHNRVNMHSTFGPSVAIPCGDLGSIVVSIGSSKTTSAMVRGGSSFTTESAEGGGLLSTSGGTTTISTFKSNTQLNEGNLVKVLTSTNVPDRAKIAIASRLSKGMTAPGFEPAAMGTREGMMYVHGCDKQLDFPFNPTGVDKIADMVSDVVDDVKEISKDVVDRPLDTLDNTVEKVADGTANISRNAALVTIFGLLASMLAVLATFKKNKTPSTGSPPPSPVESEGSTPPEPEDETPSDPTSDEPIDIPEVDEEPTLPEVKVLPWWKKFFMGLKSVLVSMFTYWNNLPDESKDKIRENLKKFGKKQK